MAYESTGVPVIMGNGDGMGMGSLGGILIGALLGGNGGLFGNRGYGAGVAGADVAMSAGIQNQINGLSAQLTTGALNSEISGLESALNAANIANLQGIGNNALLYQGGNAQVLAAQAANNYTTLSSINALGRDVTAAINQSALQELNSFNNLSTTILQGFNEIGRDTAAGFNQVIMGQNAMSAQMASCCCSIEKAIHADGEATRALINANTMASLQAQLSDAKSVINSQNIINALKPTVIV